VSEEGGGGAVSDPRFTEVMASCPGRGVVVVAPCAAGVSGVCFCGPCPPLGSFQVTSGVCLIVCFFDVGVMLVCVAVLCRVSVWACSGCGFGTVCGGRGDSVILSELSLAEGEWLCV
jgi:hypothetical protein